MQGNSLTKQFLNARAQLDDRQYLQTTIAYHAAPVYSGLRPAVLINLGGPESRLAQLWTKYPPDVDNFRGISMSVFSGMGGNLQLFCYDAGHLERVMADCKIRDYLESLGYDDSFDINNRVAVLEKGFLSGCPHEIGIFLGYPLSDVKAFIRYRGKNYIMNGYWKVYSDISHAARLFQAFDQAKRDMLLQWENFQQQASCSYNLTYSVLSEKIVVIENE